MKNSFSFCVLMLVSVVASIGCSPEASKKMDGMAQDMAGKAKGAASEIAKATGMDEMMGQAENALKSIEGGSEMLKSVTETFAKATSTFTGIKDSDSATAALPDITKLTESFGGYSEAFGKLPAAAKTAVAGVFSSALGELKPILDKVLAIPGVDAILKPAIETLMAKISSFKA